MWQRSRPVHFNAARLCSRYGCGLLMRPNVVWQSTLKSRLRRRPPILCQVGLWDAESGNLYATINHPSKVLCATTAPWGGAILTAGEGGFLSAFDQQSGKEALSIPKAHAVRIRGVAVPWAAAGEDGAAAGAATAALPRLLVTASTDGEVKLWDLRNTVRGLLFLSLSPHENNSENVSTRMLWRMTVPRSYSRCVSPRCVCPRRRRYRSWRPTPA